MLRSLVCAAAIFFLFFSVCLIPQNALARRCPVKMPETLLSLYQNSDSIYVAAFDRIEDGKVVEETEDYTAIDRKKHFIISTTLKGEASKFFVLEDVEYRYKDKPQDPEGPEDEAETPEPWAEQETKEPNGEEKVEPESAEVGDEEEVDYIDGMEPQLKSGDTVLLFVTKGDEGEAPQLTDFRDGLKKLSGEQLAAYEKRVNELNGIFAERKVNHDRILEWLIRCAQDPLTRWEGTYELLSAVQQLEWRERAAEHRRERIAAGESVEDEAPAPAGGEPDLVVQGRPNNIDPIIFAKTIDPNQKFLLANILLDRTAETAEKREMRTGVRGDRELVELIKRWGDPRLLNYLLDSLRGGADEPNVKADNMGTIAELLDDDEAEAIADKYQEIVWENDSDIVGRNSDNEETADEEKTASDADPQPNETKAPKESEAKPETETEKPEVGDAPVAKKQTYKELRAELLQKFLTRCDKAIADREKEKAAEAAR